MGSFRPLLLRFAVTLSAALAGLLAVPRPAEATLWKVGDLTTYSQVDWSLNGAPAAVTLLLNGFNTAYASTGGALEVGLPGASGYSILFTDPEYIRDGLPSAGEPGPLNQDYVNPSGPPGIPTILAGDVVALDLNIHFSDAGLLPGNSGLRFGDLVLVGLTSYTRYDGTVVDISNLNNLTVRQFLADLNPALGGGPAIDDFEALDYVTLELNIAFEYGNYVFPFGQDHLAAPGGLPTSVPEPSSCALFGAALLGIAATRRRALGIACDTSAEKSGECA
jgi:PEP-CTERM motif